MVRFFSRSYYNVDDGILYLVTELMDDSFATVLDARGFMKEVPPSPFSPSPSLPPYVYPAHRDALLNSRRHNHAGRGTVSILRDHAYHRL
jgi:hypothetical protein